MLILFIRGWNNTAVNKNTELTKEINVSVIVPARNEEKNLEFLLNDLKKQNYPFSNYEVILVDDHSDDSTSEIITRFSSANNNFLHISLQKNERGKKSAIKKAVSLSKGDLILTTDADCRLSAMWISSFVFLYNKNKPKIIAGPVLMDYSGDFFSRMQSLEFISLIGSGAGAIGAGHPIMCNGANLAFEKEAFTEEMKQSNKDSFASGDDIFFMLKIKKSNPGSIVFNKSPDAIVRTVPNYTPSGFIAQRKRWVSKSRAYRDRDIIFTAILVFLINSLILICLAGSFFSIIFLYLFSFLFLIKSIPDYFFLKRLCRFFNKPELMIVFLPLQIIYPLYIVFTAIYGNLGGYMWKQRKLR